MCNLLGLTSDPYEYMIILSFRKLCKLKGVIMHAKSHKNFKNVSRSSEKEQNLQFLLWC